MRPMASARPKCNGYSVVRSGHKSGFTIGFIALGPWRPAV
jgi:hypothetical protein